MEFVEGRTLRERLHDGPLPAAWTSPGSAPSSPRALAYVHAPGRSCTATSSRPTSCSTPTARTASAQLTDFGIAQLDDGARLTAHGTTVGTANYLSPEQARAARRRPGQRRLLASVWCCSSASPAGSRTRAGIEAAVARLHRQPDVPATFGPDWAALLSAMTAREPEPRPAAARSATP